MFWIIFIPLVWYFLACVAFCYCEEVAGPKFGNKLYEYHFVINLALHMLWPYILYLVIRNARHKTSK